MWKVFVQQSRIYIQHVYEYRDLFTEKREPVSLAEYDNYIQHSNVAVDYILNLYNKI